MRKVQLFILFCCVLLSVAVIAGFYILSPLNGEIYRGPFDRSFDVGLSRKSVLNLEFNSFYFAGATKENIYLGNTTAPLHLFKTNRSLTDSQHIRLSIALDSVRDFRRFRILVDSPYFFMTHGTQPQILRGTLGEWRGRPIMRDTGYYFLDAVPISASTFGLKAFNLRDRSAELEKKTLDSGYFNNDLLVKQIDGVFCVDGKLLFAKDLNRLVYLHYYRNEFTVIDTSLVLQYRGHTVDTFSHAWIKVAKLKEGDQSMLSSPPMTVNGLSCVDRDRLYVQSTILARNEDPQDFATGAVIDVYNLVTNAYEGSLHIPRYEDETMHGFQVLGDMVFVLSGDFLVSYELLSEKRL